MHIKKGDQVKVISGKSKGLVGLVLRALPKDNKIVVEGVAIAKRHVKGRPGHVGRIVERPLPIDASNVKRISTEKTTSVFDASAK